MMILIGDRLVFRPVQMNCDDTIGKVCIRIRGEYGGADRLVLSKSSFQHTKKPLAVCLQCAFLVLARCGER